MGQDRPTENPPVTEESEIHERISSAPEGADELKKPEVSVSAVLQKLEQSDVSADLKELIHGWTEQHLNGVAREAYVDWFKEKGTSATIADLLEAASDTKLNSSPELKRKFQNGEISAGELAEGMFDAIFGFALSGNQRAEVEKILDRFKQIVGEAVERKA